MAHNIGEMFYVGERPWHGLGLKLAETATMEEALRAGDLDWVVTMKPMTLLEHPGKEIRQRLAVVRADRADCVLGVVHPNFRPLQNREGAELFDQLLGEGKRHYETGGYLKNGEVVWLLAKRPKPIQLAGGDMLSTYLLYSNSHDGTYAIDIRMTAVRVVCNNTLNIALGAGARPDAFRRSHNYSPRMLAIQAEQFFEWTESEQAGIEKSMNKLDAATHDDEAFGRFLHRLIPIPAEPLTADMSPSVRKGHETRCSNLELTHASIADLRLNGLEAKGLGHPAISPAPKTLWGTVNTITAWVDHCQEVKGDWYAHIMFGAGDRLKRRAFELALELVDD